MNHIRSTATGGRTATSRLAFVEHTFEEQTRGRRGEPRRQTVAVQQQPRSLLFGQAAASHLDQHTHQSPHHLPEKVRSLHVDDEQIVIFVDVQRIHQHVGRRVFRIGVGEGLEVVKADEPFGGRSHPRQVEILFHPPDKWLRECGAATGYLVDVAAAEGTVSRVKAVANRFDTQDIDVGGQCVIDAAAQDLRRDGGLDIEVSYLGQCVDAGIGAA